MTKKEELQKRDLSALRFEVIDEVGSNKPIHEGDLRNTPSSIYKYSLL